MFNTKDEVNAPHQSLDPEDWAGFRAQSHRMLDDMLDYIEHIRQRPVWQPIPPETRARFDQPLPVEPTSLADAHASFMHDILPYAAGNVHPRFMGWVQGGGTPAGMLAEMLAAGLNANVGGRDQMPVEVERQVVRWMRELFAFPDTASGVFVTGTSMANFMALVVARTAAMGTAVRRDGVRAHGELIAYTSAGAHGCIARAMDMAGVGTHALRMVAVDAQHRIDLAALERAIAADRAAGLTPFMVIGTAGTVDTGAIDDLDALAEIARRESLWLHVDGAYGALGRLAPDIAPLLAGIERADSLAFDFHKWGQVPYDAGFLLVRDGARHKDAFAAPAAYLRREARGLAAGSPWPCDFGPDLSRGFRALKTWMTFKVIGTQALGAAISHSCRLARYMSEQVQSHPQLELLAPVSLNVVCFRYRCEDADTVNRELVADLHEAGVAVPSTTVVKGRLAIRAALVNHRTRFDDVDALLAAVVAAGDARCELPPKENMKSLIEAASRPGELVGVAPLMRCAMRKEDMQPLGVALLQRAQASEQDGPAWLDLSTYLQLTGERASALAVQAEALRMQQHYRLPARPAPGLRLLALMGPGDLMANTPVEFLVEDSDVALELLYVTADGLLPPALPEHDVMLVAVGESDANQALLEQLAQYVPHWPRPVLNQPSRIAALSRDGVCQALAGVRSVELPLTIRVDRATLAALGAGDIAVTSLLPGDDFPLIVRPLGSHAGHDLDKVDGPADLAAYLERVAGDGFYLARFVDYRSADGQFRKYRVVLVDGKPYLCHLAVSSHWMIHYLNAGMGESADKRREEAESMEHFDAGFATRHAAALAEIDQRIGLPYVGIDCAETPDGRLLVFEIDNAMIVHGMDPEDVYPYKKAAMAKVFAAFRALLGQAAGARY